MSQSARGSRERSAGFALRSLETVPDTRRLDDTAGRIEGGLYIHIGRIQQDGVLRLHHRGGTPAGVAALKPGDRVRGGVDGVTEFALSIA